MGKRSDDTTLELLPPEQVFLFENWPEQPSLVDRVKEYVHTGKRLLKDADRCYAVIAAILNGASPRAVANHFHVGRETLTAAYRVLEEGGKLGPFKQRLASEWRETAMLAQWRMQEALVRGEMPLQVLPALGGIATDKIELLTHSMPEEERQKTIDVTSRTVLDAMRRVSAGDAASDAPSRNVLSDSISSAPDTSCDTPERLEPMVDQAGGGGGGVSTRPPVPTAEGMG
jgi:hypothetical protein